MTTIHIPGPSFSKSRGQRKGLKCWAKLLTHVSEPARTGYDFEGAFITVGATVEIQAGDVILHVDDDSSSGIGIATPNAKGDLWWHWVATTNSAKWQGPLANTAREYLALDRPERVRRSAAAYLTYEKRIELEAAGKVESIAHYEALAGVATTQTEVDPRDEAIATIRALMAEHAITVAELA